MLELRLTLLVLSRRLELVEVKKVGLEKRKMDVKVELKWIEE